MTAKEKHIHKIKLDLYQAMKAVWKINQDKFSPHQNECIKLAFSYSTEYGSSFVDNAERYIKTKGKGVFELELNKQIPDKDSEKAREGFSHIFAIYASQFHKSNLKTTKEYEKRIDANDVKNVPRWITNSLAAKDEGDGVNIDSFGKYELITMVYLFDVFLSDTNEYFGLKSDMAININYNHIIKTAKLTNNRNAKDLIKKAITNLSDTKVNISVSKDLYQSINIIEVQRDKETNELKKILLHPEAKNLQQTFQKYIKIGINVYDIFKETNSSKTLMYTFKFIDISKGNNEFKNTIEGAAKMLKIDISDKHKKSKFVNKELKKIIEILSKYKYIKSSKLDSKNFYLEFNKTKIIEKK